jgi:hypothetical protein
VSSRSQQALRVDPELDRQVFGYWFAPGEAISPFPPGPPTGAVLPRIGASLDRPEVLCLDLVPVQNSWIVLSELGRYTYRHTSGLLHDDPWRFVPVQEAVGTWPVVFAVTYADSLTCDEIKACYGPDAASRARPDAPAVQLRLTPGAAFEMAIPPGDDLSDEERAALHAALERAADDAEAGRGVDAFEYLREYRARLANHTS